jgi:hypothetical protein
VSRLSKMTDPDDFDAEFRRERLRRQKWNRVEQFVLSLALAVAIVASSVDDHSLLNAVLRLFD